MKPPDFQLSCVWGQLKSPFSCIERCIWKVIQMNKDSGKHPAGFSTHTVSQLRYISYINSFSDTSWKICFVVVVVFSGVCLIYSGTCWAVSNKVGMATWKHITICILNKNCKLDEIVLIIAQRHYKNQIYKKKKK